LVVSVASGKGGTGKTTVSANLARVESRRNPVTFIDCDVEEPDSHFFLKPEWTGESEVHVEVPVVDTSCCDACGECSRFCRYNALAVLEQDVLVFDELCHSCGGCAMVCPADCISMKPRRIGIIRYGESDGIDFFQGLLDIGEPMAVPVIDVLKGQIEADRLCLLDCPPGTGCPMIQSVAGTDYCLMVTEPSPFGRHDLELAHLVAARLEVPHGVIINRSRGDDGIITDYCKGEGISVLGRIPFSRRAAELCSSGELLADADEEIRELFEGIIGEVSACIPAS
jgi:MinD superfamily P-loop ATPase